ncbi:MAG: Gfo/Idh/MocA family oxidoreductase [Firmicutes bacterium]|nr:Gfo/Idh/MocA family oxidoreductase [Bacillota bacterium]
MIRVGVIGYGTIGQIHCAALQEVSGCKLVAAADVDPEARARAQKDFNVEVFASAEAMLASAEVDLVDICVPTHLHESIMLKAMEADKHIFCEKPLARSLEEGRRLVDLSKGYRRKIGIGHVVRFTPPYIGMRQSVEQGEVGRVGVVRTFRGGSQFPVGWQDWFANFELSGGVILDLMIHDLDFCLALFGDVERVYAKSTYGRTEAKLEHAMAVLRFKNGVIAHLEASWTSLAGQFYTTLEVAGKDGLITYDSRQSSPLSAVTGAGAAGQIGPVSVNPYALELQDMVEAIENDRSPLVSVEDAFGALEVALAAIESARTGQVVEL